MAVKSETIEVFSPSLDDPKPIKWGDLQGTTDHLESTSRPGDIYDVRRWAMEVRARHGNQLPDDITPS